LQGNNGRYVRHGLDGNQYLHLDEVEVRAEGSAVNIALGKTASQSSVSQWSAIHGKNQRLSQSNYPMEAVLDRGMKLARSLSRSGADVVQWSTRLNEMVAAWKRLTASSSSDARRSLYLEARWLVRQIALANPLLQNNPILFVKRAPTMFPHMSDQHYGWWSRGGGGIYLLEGYKNDQPRLRCLTSQLPQGNFVGPDVSYDGKKVLFAYCKFYPDLNKERNKADKANVPEDAFYHVYEMNADGTGLRQVTRGKYDDFDPRYLPDGDILFISTRKGQAIQCTQWFSDSTRHADLPNSYVRCGGDNWRPVPVFTLHAMNPEGANIRPLSAFENFEWTPSIANDGRLLYTRWDYIDRFNGHFFSLWSANQDGTNPQ
jgi:hypothetical protein